MPPRAGREPPAVVIVAHNSAPFIARCLRSVTEHLPEATTIVVDNASTDGTPAYLEQLTDAKVILNERNYGFARANNQGVAVSSGSHIVLLNNDTVVPNGWLPKLMRHLERPEFGLIVTVTNFSGNESRIDVPYTDLRAMEDFAAKYTREHADEFFDIHVAAMYCAAMRREVFDKVGPLDEQFSVGMFEDDDYSERMRKAGYRVVCVEDVFIHHFGQASFKKLSQSEYQAIWDRNKQLYEKKWGIEWKPHKLRAGSG
jgi:GT2 family glycosyltransferase